MAEEQIRSVIDGIRARLQAELEAQLGNLADTHEQAIHQARRSADADAEERWGSKLDAARAEWGAQLESEVTAARAEVERAMVAQSMRARIEAEQAAADAAAAARGELEEAVAAERTRAQADLERAQAERERAHADLERARADLERVQADRERAQSDRERTQAELQRAHTDLEDAKTELQRVQADVEPTKAHLQRARADVECAQTDRDRAQASLERALTDLEGAQADLERTQADLQRTQADLERAQADLLRAHAHAEEVRAGAARELDRAREAFRAERDSAADAVAATQHAAASFPHGASELLSAVRAIDEASSLTEALAATVRGAALESPRVALFIAHGATLQEWPVDGVPSVDAGPIRSDGREAGFLADVLRRGEALSIDGTNGRSAPAFAGLSPGRRAIAVPFVLGGRAVAVLYADEGSDGQPLASWLETVQILGRHATSVVAALTAVRTARALRLIGGAAADGSGPMAPASMSMAGASANANEDDAQSARRYARLLVSEIKLYNEGALRMGRERRDILQRLKPEIERARRLYDERVAPTIHARDTYFQEELVQTLADGDRSLLG
jgi:multidrug resistance efflux pump